MLTRVFVTANLHGAYVWHFVKRSRHNARDGITVEIPAQEDELCASHHFLRVSFFYQTRRRVKIGRTRYLQSFEARQTGEHLVVHLSQPILGQKPAKRKLVNSRNEARRQEIQVAPCYTICRRFFTSR